MDDGIDVESRSSQDAPRPEEDPAQKGGEEAADDNKFQKAIGAWRSKQTLLVSI
jgi:homeobox protein cut-like